MNHLTIKPHTGTVCYYPASAGSFFVPRFYHAYHFPLDIDLQIAYKGHETNQRSRACLEMMTGLIGAAANVRLLI